MPPKLGVIMDSIADITPYKDTTLAMLLEAQRRGWPIRYMTHSELSLHGGEAWGRWRTITVWDDDKDWYRLGEQQESRLGELDILLMRKDPPVDTQYLYTTHILDRAEHAGVLVANRPSGLRDAQEKLFTTHFPECCAPQLVDTSAGALKGFVKTHGKAVLKPLHGMGGDSIFVVTPEDPNLNVIIEGLSQHGTRFVMAQAYLPEIQAGDKRILLIDGEPVPYALARIPSAGETRGNIAAGGRGKGVTLSERDRWICARIAPALRARGVRFAGLDVIGDYITEVNVTSPTCLRELDAIYGLNIASDLFDALAASLPHRGQ